MSYLLDTNVLSELRKRSPNEGVVSWMDSTHGNELYLSVLVVGEVRQGIERLRTRDPARSQAIETWLAKMQRSFGDRVLPVNGEVAQEWGRMNAAEPLPIIDGLLAATAKVHDLTLVTRNVADVKRSGTRVLDPFS